MIQARKEIQVSRILVQSQVLEIWNYLQVHTTNKSLEVSINLYFPVKKSNT